MSSLQVEAGALENLLARVRVRFRSVRRRTLELVAPLTPEDMMVQSLPEASPAKWHLAHTAWFFESFVLREFLPGYRVFHPDFAWLFNSYYQTFAKFPEKRLRSSFSRPGIEEILAFRAHVDEGMERLLEAGAEAEALRRVELGLNHEEQHQELLLTDILNAFYTNPLRPVYREGTGNREQGTGKTKAKTEAGPSLRLKNACGQDDTARFGGIPPLRQEKAARMGHGSVGEARFVRFEGGLREVGGGGGGFSFDNELPRHKVWLEPFALADRLVTCGEFAEFIADGGYGRGELWLSDGWKAVQANGWRGPLYWDGLDSNDTADWGVFTLRGEMCLSEIADAPVSHVSFYEADAYARWAGARLATEFEWETAAESQEVGGNLMEAGVLRPLPPGHGVQEGRVAQSLEGPIQLFGDCWEWTASAYLPYPGFAPLPGALGEYNGKFMSGQMVLRGGSCCTPAEHIRASYRNFFAPETRWQFSGVRLAER